MRNRLVDVLDDSRSVLLGSWPMRPFSWLLVGMLVNLVGDVSAEDWVKAGECFAEFRKFYSKSDSCDIAATHEAEVLLKSSQTSIALKLLEELMSRKEKDAKKKLDSLKARALPTRTSP